MNTRIKYILENYLNLPLKVDSSTEVYKLLVRELPKELSDYLQRDDIRVVGSMGKGNKTLYPWISILNTNITNSTQYGLYVVLLFKADMSGIYLSLNQGITNFRNLYKKEANKNAQKTVEYFRAELKGIHDFSEKEIDLNSTKGSLGEGYEKTNIISKYYSKDNFSEKELFNDISKIMSIYDFIYNHINDSSYDEVLQSVLSHEYTYLIDSDEAVRSIDQMLVKETTYPRDKTKQLEKVNQKGVKREKFKRITNRKNTKVDYLSKASKDILTGLEGEKLAIEYERNRLNSLGLEEYAAEVKWISQQTDVAGYDVISYRINPHTSDVEQIYIEVKTSTAKIDTEFFVSKNEYEVSKEFDDRYCIFRIFDILSIKPKFYIACGVIDKNFTLDPVSYSARYKWNVG